MFLVDIYIYNICTYIDKLLTVQKILFNPLAIKK